RSNRWSGRRARCWFLSVHSHSARPPLLSFGDYEAVGVSSQFVTWAPFFLPGNRERLAGVQGGGNEPPGRRTTRRNLRHGGLPDLPLVRDAVGLHSTIRAAALIWANHRCRPMNLYTPRRPFVRSSSPESATDPGGSGKLRADAWGPLLGRGPALSLSASAVFFFPGPGAADYGTAAGAAVGSRQAF